MSNGVVLVFDTETTGLPKNGRLVDDEQPHIVEIAALLIDSDGRLIESMHKVVKPDGWTIPKKASDIHGITTEKALEIGIPEKSAVSMFIELHKKAGACVAHNIRFDNQIMRIAIARFHEEMLGGFDKVVSICTGELSKPILKIKATEAMKRSGFNHSKMPSLAEAFAYFTGGIKLHGAHGALADARACARIFFSIQRMRARGELNE